MLFHADVLNAFLKIEIAMKLKFLSKIQCLFKHHMENNIFLMQIKVRRKNNLAIIADAVFNDFTDFKKRILRISKAKVPK